MPAFSISFFFLKMLNFQGVIIDIAAEFSSILEFITITKVTLKIQQICH